MAIKGIAVFQEITTDQGDAMLLNLRAIGIDNALAQADISIPYSKSGFGSLTQAKVVLDMKNAVESKLISDYGFSFGVGDIVIVVGFNVQ